MAKPLSVLILGAGESDLKLILRLLKGAGFKPTFELVKTAAQLRTVLRKQDWQVMVSTDSLPRLKNISALQILQKSGLDIPFIVVSDKMGEEAALDLLKAGACDVLQKDTWGRLGSILKRELRHTEEQRQGKEVEAKLRDSEEKWRSLVSATPDYIALHDQGGMYLYLNHYARGFKEKDVIGSSLYKYMPAESVGLFRSYWEKALKSGTTQHFEFTGLGNGGRWRVYDQYLVPMRGKNQQVEILAVARDITLRKEVEEALRESEDKFKYVFDHSLIGKSITLPSGEINVNQAFGKMLGYSRNELKNRKWQEITHPEDVELTQRAIDQLVSGKKDSIHITKRFIHKNGSVVWVELSSAIRRDRDGKPIYFISSVIDITRRKQTEEALQSLSARQEAILAAVPDILMEVNQDKVYTWANPSGLEFFGEDVIGREADYFFEGEQNIYDAVSPLFQGSKEVIYVESWQRRRDGQKRLLAWWCRSIRDKDGNVSGALSSAHDITEGRLVGEALKKSEEKFRLAFMTGLDAIYWSTLEDGKILEVNPVFEDVFGYPREEAIGRTSLELRLWQDPADRARMLSDLMGKGRVRDLELRARKKDGKFITISYSASKMEMDNRLYILGSIRDITVRKQAEEALRDSEERFHSLFKNMRNGFAYCHMLYKHGHPDDFIYLEVNEAFETLTGLKDVIGKKVTKLIPGIRKSDPALFELYSRVALGGVPETVELYLEAQKMWFSISVYSPKREYFVAIFDVISERKRIETALQVSEEKYRGLVTEISDGIFITDNQGRLTFANPALARIHGVNSPEELMGKPFLEFIQPSMLKDVGGYFKQVVEGDLPHLALTTELIHPDGTVAAIEVVANAVQVDGKVVGTNGVVRDITERKQTQTLQEAVYRISAAAETTRTLEELYPQIHQIISSVMPAENFYITLYNEAENLLRFPYFKDAADEPFMGGIQPGRGLTAYILRTGKSLLCTQAVHDELERQGEVKLLGVASAIWLGVPLVVEGKTIGAMVVQHYTDPNAYTEREQHMLEFVSTQVAIAIRRKRAEQELRESEERFRGLYENATIGIYRTSPAGSILLANPALVSMLGYDSLEELSRRNLDSEGYEPGYPRLEFQKRIEKDGEVLGLESAWTRNDGSIIHVRESARLLRDEKNRPLYYEGTVEDITERKQAEYQREVLYQVLRSVSGQLEPGYIAHAAVETIVRLTGYPHVCIALPDEKGTHWVVRGAAGKLAAELNATYPIHKGVIGNAFKTGKTQWVRDVMKDPHYVNDVKAPGGSALRSEFVALMRGGNDLLGALNVESDRVNEFDDADVMMFQSAADIISLAFQNARLYREAQQEISVRKVAEEALRQSEAELRTLFASMHDAVMVIDREGVYRKIAPTNPELLVKPPEELVGKHLHDFFPPTQTDNFINVIRKVVETEQPAKVEYDLPIGDRTLQFETTISPLTEDTTLWVAHDITARKQAEEQILSLNTQLEQRVEERTRELRQAQDKIVRQEKLAVLGQLAGGVGHELRNPLGIISNAIYYLKNIHPDADEKVRQYYGMIEHEVRTSEKIITDLLDFARLESMERGPVSVPELVKRTMTRFQVPENIITTIRLPEKLPRVHADMSQMEQVLGNLTVNACQAMAKGGSLTIGARRVKPAPGSPSGRGKEPGTQKGMVAISVKDTGTGITPENLKLIFEPLFTTKSKGIGLGLAVSRKLAEANGGCIEVESEPGKGSTFTLFLPVNED